MRCSDIGVDLGTYSVSIYIKKEGIILSEPSVVAIQKNTNNIIEIGEKASNMIGKTPPNIEIIRPLKNGVISNYTATEAMLKYFINKAIGKQSSRRPRIAICVPSEITEVEKKAVRDATKDAGAREVFIVEEPIAAAIGAGIDISKACGYMIVDIGAGTTDVAIISLNGTVVKRSIKIAGDLFDEEIIKYVRKKYNVTIGQKTAESVKINIGTVCEDTPIKEAEIRGQNIITGLPQAIKISSYDIYKALKDSTENIILNIISVLEKAPPELSSDIYENGIIVTGGGALINGFDKLIIERTKLNVTIKEEAQQCVSIGTGEYIDYYKKMMKDTRKGFFLFKIFKKIRSCKY